MLKGIPSIIGPDLLHALQSMGHGDEIAVVDSNYPGTSAGPEIIRLDGHTVTEATDAILGLLPLDDFVEDYAVVMEVVGEPDRREPVMNELGSIVAKHEPKAKLSSLERFKFYDRVRDAYAVVQTGEARLYGNIILKKGVIRPGD